MSKKKTKRFMDRVDKALAGAVASIAKLEKAQKASTRRAARPKASGVSAKEIEDIKRRLAAIEAKVLSGNQLAPRPEATSTTPVRFDRAREPSS